MGNNKINEKIIRAAIEVHQTLDPGLLESAYQECLLFELKSQNLNVVKEKALPIVYKDVKLDYGYRIDLLIENKIAIELKSNRCAYCTSINLSEIRELPHRITN